MEDVAETIIAQLRMDDRPSQFELRATGLDYAHPQYTFHAKQFCEVLKVTAPVWKLADLSSRSATWTTTITPVALPTACTATDGRPSLLTRRTGRAQWGSGEQHIRWAYFRPTGIEPENVFRIQTNDILWFVCQINSGLCVK